MAYQTTALSCDLRASRAQLFRRRRVRLTLLFGVLDCVHPVKQVLTLQPVGAFRLHLLLGDDFWTDALFEIANGEILALHLCSLMSLRTRQSALL